MSQPQQPDPSLPPADDSNQPAAPRSWLGRPRRMPSMDFGETDGVPETTDVQGLHAPIMREKLEPRDGYEPVPLWLVGVFGALLFWGGWYLATYSGGFRADVLDHHAEARFGGLAGGDQPKAVDPVVLGEKLYKANCVSCHQATGEGVPGQYPPLAGSEWVLNHPQRLKRIVLNGLEGPLTVKGQSYNGNMPAFSRLKDEQLAAILTYIRQAWGNTAPAVTPEDMAIVRAAVATRVIPWTATELQAITEPDTAPEQKPSDTQASTQETKPATQ